MFYTFNQNNSGGSFDFDKDEGITHIVVVEADSESRAIAKAREIGIYFNGCDEGMDCPCCGDRWCEPHEGTEKPAIYGEEITGRYCDGNNHCWMEPGMEVAVHYKDGRIEWH